MAVAYLLIGSNLDKRDKMIESAMSAISVNACKILNRSSVYESKPWGFNSRNNFLNVALKVNTELKPDKLLKKIKEIEKELGRRETGAGYSDREIDIDILFYDSLHMNSAELTIPHPLLHQRKFSLVPMAEIEPDFVHPLLKQTISVILENCIDTSLVVKKKISLPV